MVDTLHAQTHETAGRRRSGSLFRRLPSLAVILVLCFSVAALNGGVTATSVDGWYRSLDKPPFNPPDWLFAPAWNLLFLLMSVAAWRVWMRAPAGPRGRALGLFAAQLAANLLWSVLFFGLRAPGWALVELPLLLALVAWTALAFARLDRPAGWLLLPYLGWIGFAFVLNASIWWLN